MLDTAVEDELSVAGAWRARGDEEEGVVGVIGEPSSPDTLVAAELFARWSIDFAIAVFDFLELVAH